MAKRYIREVSIYNMWNNKKTLHIELTKKINILTGFNGTGKSTVLEILFGLLSDRGAPLIAIQDWSAKAKLAEDVTVYVSDMGFEHELNTHQIDMNTSKLQNSKLEKLSAKSFHDAITFKSKKISNQNNNDSTLTITNENNNTSNRSLLKMVNIPKGSPFERMMLDNIVMPVFYREEVFVIPERPYANVEKGEKNLFSRNVALDITLKEMLIDFLSFEKDYNEVQKKQLAEFAAGEFINNIESYFSGLEEKNAAAIKNKILSDWHEKLASKNSSNNRISAFEKVLDGFFSCTKKKVSRDSRNMICLTDSNGVNIEWIKLSRGEKNLLVLLLLAFFAGNDEKIFILDEPDLSLHIEWQKQILSTMSMLAPNSQFIIATHSPAMLMNDLDFNLINLKDEVNNDRG